ncbi:MAG: DUF1232 domain-containing protein [Selenomonadaceae bacterium]|nr:DUF1232 domain-containing protein [Selenomonadaceae bacterium]
MEDYERNRLEGKAQVEKYEKDYSEKKLWEKIRDTVHVAGLKVLNQALILYYVAQSPNCPTKIKAGIFGALGYFISPLDLIPDLAPVVGYTDDALVIAAAIAMAQMYITDDIKKQARAKIESIFGEKFAMKLDEEL